MWITFDMEGCERARLVRRLLNVVLPAAGWPEIMSDGMVLFVRCYNIMVESGG